jgi:acetylornithine/succinyldiaminopimelate/putrescine aminotransferase
VVLNKGEGVYLWDQEGKKFLDMMSAYSAHCGALARSGGQALRLLARLSQ